MSLKQMQILDGAVAVKPEPVAWLLTDKNINSIQVDSIQRLIDRLKHAHHTDIRVRINGHDEWFEADWLKHMVRVAPPQPEQNPMSDEILQAITDPENQPSQYGTVTLDYHFEKIKKWEDLFERMSNKVLQQTEQEPVAWMNDSTPAGIFARHKKGAENFGCTIPLYTHQQPKREWVGLTDLQKGVIKFNHSKVGMMLMTEYDLDAMLEATEQALKEKNT